MTILLYYKYSKHYTCTKLNKRKYVLFLNCKVNYFWNEIHDTHYIAWNSAIIYLVICAKKLFFHIFCALPVKMWTIRLGIYNNYIGVNLFPIFFFFFLARVLLHFGYCFKVYIYTYVCIWQDFSLINHYNIELRTNFVLFRYYDSDREKKWCRNYRDKKQFKPNFIQYT